MRKRLGIASAANIPQQLSKHMVMRQMQWRAPFMQDICNKTFKSCVHVDTWGRSLHFPFIVTSFPFSLSLSLFLSPSPSPCLSQACIDDNVDMVTFLVEHGAGINQPDNEGWIPLHAAASCGYLDIAEWVLGDLLVRKLSHF